MIRNTALALVAACSALVVSACAVDTTAPQPTEEQVAKSEQPINENSCQWRCQSSCPPNTFCTAVLMCEPIGQCATQCNKLGICVDGYYWDEQACRCLPSPAQGGEPCGNVTCGAGLECCNASCGICVQPGGFCTQQVCY